MSEEGGVGAVPAGIAGWTVRGASAILDQGLFAGSNFLLSLLLARWLPPEEYGAYALAWSVFLLVAAFHTSLVTEPMLVFGAGRFAGRFRAYLGVLLRSSTLATLVPAAGLAVAGVYVSRAGSETLGSSLLALGLASPAILLLWLLRRSFYVRMQPHWAAAGSLAYLFCVLGGVLVVEWRLHLSSDIAFLVLATSSMIVSLGLLLILGRKSYGKGPATTSIAVTHWRYGKWAMAITFLSWLPNNAYFLVLPLVASLDGPATLKAVMNLLMPVLHGGGALAVLVLPSYVRTFRTGGYAGLAPRLRQTLLLFTGAAMVYAGVLLLFGNELTSWIYAGRYGEVSQYLAVAAMLPIASMATAVYGGALRAIERPDLVLWCCIISSLVTATIGLPLTVALGVRGAVTGLLLGSSAKAVALWGVWSRVRNQVPMGQEAVS